MRFPLLALSLLLFGLMTGFGEPSAESRLFATTADVEAIFKNNCTNCHRPGGSTGRDKPSGELDLESAGAFSRLINVAAEEETAAEEGMKRVVPGKPEESLLYLKISATTKEFKYGKAMPSGKREDPFTPLSAADIKTIRDWIAAGAPLSGTITSIASPKPLDKGVGTPVLIHEGKRLFTAPGGESVDGQGRSVKPFP